MASEQAIVPVTALATVATPLGGVKVQEKGKKEVRVIKKADGTQIKTKTNHKEQKTNSRVDGRHVETRNQLKEKKKVSKADGTVVVSKSVTVKRVSYTI